MHLSVVSSLDSRCREAAAGRLDRGHSDSVVVFHDLLDGSLVLRRIFRGGQLLEQAETVLEHGCLSCTVRLDVVPTVDRLAGLGYEHAALALPPGVSVDMAVTELKRGLGPAAVVDNAVLAIDPADLEDHIWDKHTLYESGFTAMPEDERTSGEFLVGELAHADTVMLHSGLGAGIDGEAREDGEPWRQGTELLAQLAPHAAVVGRADSFRPGCYDGREAAARTRLGSVRVPLECETGCFRTVLHKVERPLHPGRFRDALPQLAAGSHWMRGRLWIASAARTRIAVQGIGPRVWLESTGQWIAEQDGAGAAGNLDVDAALSWHPRFGDRGTVLAVTGRGEDVDAAEIRELLDGCALSEEEMQRDFSALEDPFELEATL
ncbi:cobalamin biosynthesis protein CobW [Arthrobacter sp. SW1]|uniref:GTP-binding protein n=1 Tax=Arthrobacter sp. SW1 TaxID=1920889 RepID=UPI000877B7D3|nr:GTP-binding protein [Arthrobacter sp. SW1]OFI39995.1 cobalamin biosynthesis protein CobW [Arthrobacter sp. SW1]